MQYLNRQQFTHVTRFNQASMAKNDIQDMLGIVRRVQQKEMEVSNAIQDVTFTVWFFIPAKGVTLRTRFEGPNAEKAKRELLVNTQAKFSGNIRPSRPICWVQGTGFNVVTPATEAIEGAEKI